MNKTGFSLPVLALLALLMWTLAGCQFTQSPFALAVSSAGAEFAAAATTLSYVHSGKISTQYAQGSFVNYRSQLDGLDRQLPSQQGAPGRASIEQLLALYKVAIRAVDDPCLETSCNWQAQVAALNRASQAFLKAAGS
jgi:hypothetical protein